MSMTVQYLQCMLSKLQGSWKFVVWNYLKRQMYNNIQMSGTAEGKELGSNVSIGQVSLIKKNHIQRVLRVCAAKQHN